MLLFWTSVAILFMLNMLQTMIASRVHILLANSFSASGQMDVVGNLLGTRVLLAFDLRVGRKSKLSYCGTAVS